METVLGLIPFGARGATMALDMMVTGNNRRLGLEGSAIPRLVEHFDF
jgi:hypothetical protein